MAIDLGTGTAELLVTMGVDRADDDATDSTTYRLLAVAGPAALVRQDSVVDGTASTTVVRYDLDTGAIGDEFPDGFAYRLESDEASCEGDAQPIGSAGGEVYGVLFGLPARIDPDTGEVEPLVAVCDPGAGLLEGLVDPATASEFIIMNTGAATDARPDRQPAVPPGSGRRLRARHALRRGDVVDPHPCVHLPRRLRRRRARDLRGGGALRPRLRFLRAVPARRVRRRVPRPRRDRVRRCPPSRPTSPSATAP